MPTELERRDAAVAWPEQDFEMRAVGDGMEFRGYAAVFNSPSEDLGGFRETILPSAFERSVNAAANGKRDIKMFLNHNSDIVLGSTRARTLRLSMDDRGLLAEATLPPGSWGQPVAEAVRRGDISAMSFGFIVEKNGDSWTPDHTQRTLHDVRLLEVSPVTGWPAYAATSASVRTLVDAIDWTDEDAIEKVLEGLGEEQRGALLRHLNTNSPTPYVAPNVAERLARLRRFEAA
jgi:HK97 family phage prohead protease